MFSEGNTHKTLAQQKVRAISCPILPTRFGEDPNIIISIESGSIRENLLLGGAWRLPGVGRDFTPTGYTTCAADPLDPDRGGSSNELIEWARNPLQSETYSPDRVNASVAQGARE